jgi:hypothetical protein
MFWPPRGPASLSVKPGGIAPADARVKRLAPTPKSTERRFLLRFPVMIFVGKELRLTSNRAPENFKLCKIRCVFQ